MGAPRVQRLRALRVLALGAAAAALGQRRRLRRGRGDAARPGPHGLGGLDGVILREPRAHEARRRRRGGGAVALAHHDAARCGAVLDRRARRRALRGLRHRLGALGARHDGPAAAEHPGDSAHVLVHALLRPGGDGLLAPRPLGGLPARRRAALPLPGVLPAALQQVREHAHRHGAVGAALQLRAQGAAEMDMEAAEPDRPRRLMIAWSLAPALDAWRRRRNRV
mmetsp:Transcript_22023/g.67624  ORF Transcript_22023/g.67624 Transcript_22023/m.67624 type:complete len:224 (-) Transcript_22023:217-888(-)